MPTPEAILGHQIWTLAHYLREHRNLVSLECEGREFEIERLEDYSDELSPHIVVHMREVSVGPKDSAVEAQPSEGDVRGSGSRGLHRTDAAAARPTTSHSGGPEEL